MKANGAQVTRVGFCPGDRLFWQSGAGDYLAYRGGMEDFGPWLVGVIKDRAVTDLVMLGDGRWPHAAALNAVANRSDCRAWIVEHGYLRPNLILVEPDGMGGASRIPAFFQAARHEARLKGVPVSRGASFVKYACTDMAYHFANIVLARWTYPNYAAHSGIHPLREYAGWVGKFLRRFGRRRTETEFSGAFAQSDAPVFLYPLQLSQDFQLKKYGVGQPQPKTLEDVVTSFLSAAPVEAKLIIKEHPLDNGLHNWAAQIEGMDHGGRVLFTASADLEEILERVSGVVTINSTVGLTALIAGVPVKVLGRAIYDLEGMTATMELDRFWTHPQKPDGDLVASFVVYLRDMFHVAGTFDGPGAKAGAANLADWLLARQDAWL